MDYRAIDTPFGPGEVILNQGVLRHISLPPRTIDGVSFNCAILGLSSLTDADPMAALPDVIARATPTFKALPHIHAEAMALLLDSGWPPDIPFPKAWAQYSVEPKDQRPAPKRACGFEVLYHAAGPHLPLGINDTGRVVPLFSDEVFATALRNAEAEARFARLPQLTHATFGTFTPAPLQTLCHKTLNRQRVAIDLYLPDAALERITLADLDPFVGLHKDLRKRIGPVLDAAVPLGVDWLADWLAPENAELTDPLFSAFPDARSGAIRAEDLRAALRLTRLSLAPFGTGTEVGAPCATWDLHVLPKGADDQVFAITTAPDGTVLSATLES